MNQWKLIMILFWEFVFLYSTIYKVTFLIPDHLKPEVCTFMAVYTIRKIRELYEKDDATGAASFGHEFCM